jgi:hypothetical protein
MDLEIARRAETLLGKLGAVLGSVTLVAVGTGVGFGVLRAQPSGRRTCRIERVAFANLPDGLRPEWLPDVYDLSDWMPPPRGAIAVSIALERMNSDSETPRERAVSASMSRSRGRRRTATKAVRCLDSERLRGMPCPQLPVLLTVISSKLRAAVRPWGASDHGTPVGGITASACRGGYTASTCDHRADYRAGLAAMILVTRSVGPVSYD